MLYGVTLNIGELFLPPRRRAAALPPDCRAPWWCGSSRYGMPFIEKKNSLFFPEGGVVFQT